MSNLNPPTTIIPYDQSVRILNHPILAAQDVLTLDKYYILYWEAAYLKSVLRSDGYDSWIKREGVDYKVYFYADMGKDYLDRFPGNQIRLSFRRVKNRIKGIVLVSKISGEQNDSN